MSIDAIQRNPLTYPIQQAETSDDSCCKISAVALSVMKVLGILLLAASVPCFMASLAIPAILLMVTGTASFIFGTTLCTKAPAIVNPPPPPQPPVERLSFLSPQLVERINGVSSVVSFGTESAKIAGAVFGQGLGDAIGLATNAYSREEAQEIVDEAFDLTSPAFEEQVVVTNPRGSFTKYTEYACAATRAVDQHKKHPEKSVEVHFAEQLNHWRNQGLDTFGGIYQAVQDPACYGMSQLLRGVQLHPQFLEAPITAALEAWKYVMGDTTANGDNLNNDIINWKVRLTGLQDKVLIWNDALSRAPAIASIYHKDLIDVVENTILLTKVTHADPRVIAASVAFSVAVTLFIRGWRDFADVQRHCEEIATLVLCDEMVQKRDEYMHSPWKYANYKNELKNVFRMTYERLELDEEGHSVFKCLGAAFQAVRMFARQPDQEGFIRTMKDLIREGGATAANAAAAGALIGAYQGHSADRTFLPGPGWYDQLNPEARAVLEENAELAKSLSETT